MKHLQILILLLTLCGTSHASFSQNTRRYLSPKDIMALWSQKFPQTTKIEYATYNHRGCWMIGAQNVNFLGVVNPAIGSPAVLAPPAEYVRWLGTCTSQILAAQFKVLLSHGKDEKLYRKYFPNALLEKYQDGTDPDHAFKALTGKIWSELSEEEQRSLILFSVEEMIGPEPVLKDMGFVKDMAEMVVLIQNSIKPFAQSEVSAVLQKVLLATALREEFITY